MPWFPAVPPALAAADGGRFIKKQRAGLPKLLHKLFIKVLRLRPASLAAAAEGFYGGFRMGAGEELCYYYSYGGAGSSWARVLSSILEEDGDSSSSGSDEGSPDAAPAAVLRKAKSERFLVGPPNAAAAAAVVHVEVLL